MSMVLCLILCLNYGVKVSFSMHEMSIAQYILDIVEENVRKHNLNKVIAVNVRVGELRAIVPDQLQFCFNFITKNTVAEGSRLNLEVIPIKIRCDNCQKVFIVKDFNLFCPDCNNGKVVTIEGHEFVLQSIEGE